MWRGHSCPRKPPSASTSWSQWSDGRPRPSTPNPSPPRTPDSPNGATGVPARPPRTRTQSLISSSRRDVPPSLPARDLRCHFLRTPRSAKSHSTIRGRLQHRLRPPRLGLLSRPSEFLHGRQQLLPAPQAAEPLGALRFPNSGFCSGRENRVRQHNSLRLAQRAPLPQFQPAFITSMKGDSIRHTRSFSVSRARMTSLDLIKLRRLPVENYVFCLSVPGRGSDSSPLRLVLGGASGPFRVVRSSNSFNRFVISLPFFSACGACAWRRWLIDANRSSSSMKGPPSVRFQTGRAMLSASHGLRQPCRDLNHQWKFVVLLVQMDLPF